MESSTNKVEVSLHKLQKSCEEKLLKLEKTLDVVQEKEKILNHLKSIPSKQVELSKMIVESAHIQLQLGKTKHIDS